jgi:hypothetical protein
MRNTYETQPAKVSHMNAMPSPNSGQQMMSAVADIPTLPPPKLSGSVDASVPEEVHEARIITCVPEALSIQPKSASASGEHDGNAVPEILSSIPGRPIVAPSSRSESTFEPEISESKPDYVLPKDFYGLPYGPIGVHYSKLGSEAELWDDTYTSWMYREATPAEKLFCNRRDKFLESASGLINNARLRKHPSMPTLSAIDYYKIPHNMDDLLALRSNLNEAEREYVGWLDSVLETDPNYPAKTDCFSSGDSKFYRNWHNEYLKLNSTQYQEQLAAEGYDIGGKHKTTRESEVSKITLRVTRRQVTVVEKLSGMEKGYHNLGNRAGKFLALSGPIFPAEVEGEAPTIMRYLKELAGYESDNGEQFDKLMDWLADAYRCRKDVNRRQHRALLLAGPKNSGKGVFTKTLLATLLGGRDRATNAAKYLLGKTEFNGEWAKADLLYVDDAVGDGKMSTKIQTADAIKSVVAGDGIQSIHAKGIAAVDMPVWWRLVICLNDTEEVLATLPPLVDGFDDKFIMIQCDATIFGGDGDKTSIIEAIKAETGQFARILATREIRDGDGRGPKSWIAPSLRDKLLATSPETELLDHLIRARDNGLFDERGASIKVSECSRDKLHHMLARNACGTYPNLCRTARTLGTYLRRMEQHGWVTSRKKDGYTLWSWADAGHTGK